MYKLNENFNKYLGLEENMQVEEKLCINLIQEAIYENYNKSTDIDLGWGILSITIADDTISWHITPSKLTEEAVIDVLTGCDSVKGKLRVGISASKKLKSKLLDLYGGLENGEPSNK